MQQVAEYWVRIHFSNVRSLIVWNIQCIAILFRCKARARSKAGEYQGRIKIMSAEHNHGIDEVHPSTAN